MNSSANDLFNSTIMDKLLLLIFSSVFLFSSCAEQFNIAGNSSIACLDGRMLYLRVNPDGNDFEPSESSSSLCLDSCQVVHGRFNFMGEVDSVMLAMLYTGNQCVMPIVIENGNLNIQVDNISQKVSGGPLNDKLYSFFKKRNRFENEIWELQQKTICMMRNGCSPEEIQRKVGRKADELSRRSEELEIKFVKDNYNNVLGPGFFMLLCNKFPTPIITQQINRILEDAPELFLNNPFVRNYIQQAHNRIAVQPQITTTTTITIDCP